MHITESGTLIVAIPNSEGLLVAADSRAVLHNEATREFSDAVYKIVEVARPFRTVICVPGSGVMHQVPDESSENLQASVDTASTLLDIPGLVKSCLENGPEDLNDELIGNEMTGACLNAARKAAATEKDCFRAFEGKTLC